MEGQRFDAWVKWVSGDALGWELRHRAGRRGMLTGAIGGVAATVVGVQTREESRAKKKRKKKKKATVEGEGICGQRCGTLCETDNFAALNCNFSSSTCLCLKSTSGEVHCVDAAATACPADPAVDQCQDDSDCGGNAVCIPTEDSPCCDDPGDAQVNLCIPLCLNLTKAAATTASTSNSLYASVRKRLPGR